ncbi:MAG TPA: hypothetical protein PLA71_00260 [Saccharofermentans sp.]|nr:hypothetical protein [Saccharofermentans sp.]
MILNGKIFVQHESSVQVNEMDIKQFLAENGNKLNRFGILSYDIYHGDFLMNRLDGILEEEYNKAIPYYEFDVSSAEGNVYTSCQFLDPYKTIVRHKHQNMSMWKDIKTSSVLIDYTGKYCKLKEKRQLFAEETGVSYKILFYGRQYYGVVVNKLVMG